MRTRTTTPADLDGIRESVAALAAEIEEVATAPRDVTEAIADAHAELAQRRERFIGELGLAGRWSSPPGTRPLHLTDLDAGWTALDLALWLHLADVEARVAEAIRADYAGRPGGLPAAERAERLEMLRAQWLRELIREEEAIRHAEAAGIVIERREDAPAAVVVAIDLARVTVDDVTGAP